MYGDMDNKAQNQYLEEILSYISTLETKKNELVQLYNFMRNTQNEFQEMR